jgi:hypothetical protein
MGASAKILYCCARGLALSSSLTSRIELFPITSRGSAKTLHEATDLIAQRLKGNSPMPIDVELDLAFKPM